MKRLSSLLLLLHNIIMCSKIEQFPTPEDKKLDISGFAEAWPSIFFMTNVSIPTLPCRESYFRTEKYLFLLFIVTPGLTQVKPRQDLKYPFSCPSQWKMFLLLVLTIQFELWETCLSSTGTSILWLISQWNMQQPQSFFCLFFFWVFGEKLLKL